MLNEILPRGAVSAASRIDLDVPLFPEEERLISKAVEKRRREFQTGRACARAALGQLGVPPQAIPSGPEGAPRWPAGVVGSITHCSGYRACAVAREADLAAIGVDAEPDKPLPAGVLSTIALPQERKMVGELAAEAPGVNWDRLLFSMKECTYKAWFPLAGRWLGFDDVVITIDRSRQTFETRFLVGGPTLDDHVLLGFSGRWLARAGLVLTAITYPAVADGSSG